MDNEPKIPGGYFIVARKMFDGELMNKPPLHMKLWAWMLNSAFWKDVEKLKRGQFHTSIEAMREAMSYKVGYRKMAPTKDEIRSAYEAFTKATMITTTKTTRGMIITLCNYSLYQDFKNYESHSEHHNENSTKTTDAPQDREVRLKKESKTFCSKPKKPVSPDALRLLEFFEELWKVYPRKEGKSVAQKHYHKTIKTDSDKERINLALGNYLDHIEKEKTESKFILAGKNWFRDWQDWEPKKND